MRLDALLRPRSVAVLGASERPSIGRAVVESLELMGFPGDIYPINPKYETLLGRRCYPSIASLPAGVDCLAVCVNHERVLEHMRPAAERNVGAVVVFDGGFGEAGPEGRRVQNEIASICREANIAFCGPNCMGVVNPHDRSMVYVTALRDPATGSTTSSTNEVDAPAFRRGSTSAPIIAYQVRGRAELDDTLSLVLNPRGAVAYGGDSLLAYVEGYGFQGPTRVPIEVRTEADSVLYSDSLTFRGGQAVESQVLSSGPTASRWARSRWPWGREAPGAK